jgi:hypothetical protein
MPHSSLRGNLLFPRTPTKSSKIRAPEKMSIVSMANSDYRLTCMNLSKLLLASLFAFLVTGPAFADAPCCEKAKGQGRQCDHPCCIKAKAEGRICEKCNKVKAPAAPKKPSGPAIPPGAAPAKPALPR